MLIVEEPPLLDGVEGAVSSRDAGLPRDGEDQDEAQLPEEQVSGPLQKRGRAGRDNIISATPAHRGAATGAIRRCSDAAAAGAEGPSHRQAGHRASRADPAGQSWAGGGAYTVLIEKR